MAKVATIEFELNKVRHKVPVNVGVSGIFKAVLPEEVATALGVRREMTNEKLASLEQEFTSNLKRYKEAETVQEVFIGISYGSSGRFSQTKEGHALFPYSSSDKYSVGSFPKIDDQIGFSFGIFVLETVDGAETWYHGRKGSSYSWMDQDKLDQPDKVFKGGRAHSMSRFKLIPYNDEHYSTLKVARENLRKISEMLFNFVEQDSTQIQVALSGGKFLLDGPHKETI